MRTRVAGSVGIGAFGTACCATGTTLSVSFFALAAWPSVLRRALMPPATKIVASMGRASNRVIVMRPCLHDARRGRSVRRGAGAVGPDRHPSVALQVLLPASASLPDGASAAATVAPCGATTSTVTDVSPDTWHTATVLAAVHRPSAVRTTEPPVASMRSWPVLPARPATRTVTVYVGRAPPTLPDTDASAGGCGVGSWVGEGLVVGFVVGLVVGFEVGLEVGFDVGLVVGFDVGFDVGLVVGLDVGLLVGLDVGLLVGLSVGSVVWPGVVSSGSVLPWVTSASSAGS